MAGRQKGDAPAGRGAAVRTSFCNRYAGDYRLDGYAITIGALGGTETACDPTTMAAERVFRTALAAVENITRDGEALVLSSPDVSLTFTRQGSTPDRELAGTTWTLDTLVDSEVASSVLGSPTPEPAPDGTATGSTGCRGLLGTWQVVGDVLSLDVARDDIGCPEPGAARTSRCSPSWTPPRGSRSTETG